MSAELNFEAMPFAGYDGSRARNAERGGFDLDEELGRRAPSRSRSQGFAARQPRVPSMRSAAPAASRPGKPKMPPFPPPRIPRRRPWGAIEGPYGVAPAPFPAEPAPTPTPSEYIRWVQSALNDVLGLQLPVHGGADAATRSAIRRFQSSYGLPVDGVVGPDTERALLAARSGRAAPGSATTSGPAEPAPASPAGELGFEWENFEGEW